jgi:hypothetical protein
VVNPVNSVFVPLLITSLVVAAPPPPITIVLLPVNEVADV